MEVLYLKVCGHLLKMIFTACFPGSDHITTSDMLATKLKAIGVGEAEYRVVRIRLFVPGNMSRVCVAFA